ncbi:hypothetical protein BDF21DRAFT_419503 [Thamnidium elegans]|nr:hypothetical protein BDF21DRAFT_419503 [Thamnidium elegans]
MLYAFYCNIVQANREDKVLVYIGYIWMFVTIGVSFAATLMTNTIEWNYYDSSYMEHIYNVVAITMLSSWGFIAVIILLYFRNNQLFNEDNATSVVIYIFLVLIQAITTTVILYGSSNSNGAHPAVVFFLTDVPMYIAIIIAAHFGPVWIGDELKIKKVNGNTKSDDLEANHGSN